MSSLIKNFRYRPEIDGLRAVAVLIVVLFHCGLGCPGGYVGVDVFLVISGYLITTLIIKDLEAGKFSMLDFWERRARRILPASIVVFVVTAIAGWWLLLPSDFSAFGKSLGAQAVFAANFYFWRNTNYFAGAADEQPLLHTWSLAVEEQFYMVVPLLLLGLFAFPALRRRSVLAALFALGVVLSFGLSVVLLDRMPAATFYLLPTRAWELLAGSLIAIVPASRMTPKKWLREILAVLGMLLILIPTFLYTKETPFPGLTALPPVLGAALFILCCSAHEGQRLPAFGRILAWKPLVFIGLISYSFYLWHWPLVAFSHYWALGELSFFYRVGLLVASFALAVLSWQYVETPFRKRSFGKSRKSISLYGALGLAACGIIAAFLVGTSGSPSRFSEQILSYDATKAEQEEVLPFAKRTSLKDARAGNFIRLGAPDPAPVELMVWGDSHSRSILPGVDQLAKRSNVSVLAAWNSSTPPVLEYIPAGKFSKGVETPAINLAVLRAIQTKGINKVLLVARWQEHFKRDADNVSTFTEAFQKTINELMRMNCKVWVMVGVPIHLAPAPKALSRHELFGDDLSQYACDGPRFERQHTELLDMKGFFAKTGVTVLNPRELLWDESSARFRMELEGRALYYDEQHLSPLGAQVISPMFTMIFEYRP